MSMSPELLSQMQTIFGDAPNSQSQCTCSLCSDNPSHRQSHPHQQVQPYQSYNTTATTAKSDRRHLLHSSTPSSTPYSTPKAVYTTTSVAQYKYPTASGKKSEIIITTTELDVEYHDAVREREGMKGPVKMGRKKVDRGLAGYVKDVRSGRRKL